MFLFGFLAQEYFEDEKKASSDVPWVLLEIGRIFGIVGLNAHVACERILKCIYVYLYYLGLK